VKELESFFMVNNKICRRKPKLIIQLIEQKSNSLEGCFYLEQNLPGQKFDPAF
jgi:hypothetical protein